MTEGYSNKALAEKLGVLAKLQKGFVDFLVLNEPENYFEYLGDLPDEVRLTREESKNLDMVHFFTKDFEDFKASFIRLRDLIKKDGFLWVSWPKGKSEIETDLNENIIREFGLQNGMVDVKVIAVDEDWSGLKFVFRLKDR